MKCIKKILDNDMNVIMVPLKNTKIIAMGFFIKAGSRNETDENSGVAHFLEHMMFKGTVDRTPEKLFDELDTLGTVYNAATTTQYTYYYIYGNSDDTKKILDIMLDIYINPDFNTREINKERKVIIEEMRMTSDSPLMKLYSTMHEKIFSGTSLARDVIGNLETVSNLKKSDFVNFRSALYKPENTVFAIAGNFSPKPVFDLVRKFLNPIENSDKNPVTYFHEKTTIFKNMANQKEPYVYIKQNKTVQQVYVLMAFPIYDLYSYKYKEIDLLSQLLSAGFSSRLRHALREKNGITYTSSSYPIVYSDCGLFIIQMVVSPQELIKGLKIILRELRRTKEELIPQSEMKKIINVTKNETLYSLARPIDILTYFGLNFLINREFDFNLEKELGSIKRVKSEQIKKVAQEIFVRNKINLFMYGNIDETNFDFIDV